MAPRNKADSKEEQEPVDREALAEGLQQRLQDKYLKYCDPAIPILRAAMTVAKIITMRMWMYILSARSKSDMNIRNYLFRHSVEVLQLSTSLLNAEEIAGWAWHSKTHVQWYSVAFLLTEVCWRPPSKECDDAWEAVNTVYDTWSAMEGEKKGNLWRPIRRLMARARYVREMQKMGSTLPGGATSQWRASTQDNAPALPNVPVAASETNPYSSTIPSSTNDPLMAMLHSDTFGSFDQSLGIFGILEMDGFRGTPGYIPDMALYPSLQRPTR